MYCIGSLAMYMKAYKVGSLLCQVLQTFLYVNCIDITLQLCAYKDCSFGHRTSGETYCELAELSYIHTSRYVSYKHWCFCHLSLDMLNLDL